MTKKIFDIFPPNQKKEKEIFKKTSSKSFSRQKEVLISIAIFLFLLGVFLYFKLPRLDLEIWPKANSITFSEQIIVDKDAKNIDILNKIIPGEIFEEEKELWQEFPATGTVLEKGKAQGIIRVYNKFNPPTSITLRATTRFLSDSGKYFISPQKIYIPPAKIEKGKIVSTWVDIEVVAIEAGEDYNIGPAKFSIPGLVGTPYYYTVYGESSVPMEGGFKKASKQVTEEDIKKAENTLTEKLLADVETSLRNKISSEFILLDNAILKEVVEDSSLVKAGAIVSKFNFQAKVKAKCLVFKNSDLESLIKKFILFEIENSKKLFEESLKINYRPQDIDMTAGKITLNLEVSAKIYPDINKQELFALIRGKGAKEIQENISRDFSEEISQIKINLWPFWAKKTPQNINRIKIKLNLE